VLEWLRSSDRHPTAAQIHRALESEMPSLSLGTVYRNLEVLVAEGQVDEVPVAGGAARYDANVDPHHHFTCEECRQIVDVEVRVPRGISSRLEDDHGLRARKVSISFYGLCPECEQTAAGESAGAMA
jgi:Fe2+ or Zn2+ uptake regulation protein